MGDKANNPKGDPGPSNSTNPQRNAAANNRNPNDEGAAEERLSSIDDSLPSILGELKTILVNRVRGDARQGPVQAIESSNSSDSGVFRFSKTDGIDENENNANIAKAEVFIYMTIPPDGGYAWLVLITAFLCQVVIDGVLFSIGILLPYMSQELSLSFKQTALVASSQIGIFFLSAPLGSAFINKYGFRPVAVSGAIIAAISIYAASYSSGTLTLVLFFGLCAGPAMGVFWVSSSLIVNYYFERYRALVGAVASSGSGMGVMLVTVLDAELVELIGWRDTTRVHAVILIVAGLLAVSYREVKPTKVGQFFEFAEEDTDESGGNSIVIGTETYSLYALSASEPVRPSVSSPSVARNLENRISYQIEFSTEKEPFCRRFCSCCFRKRELSGTVSRRYMISHDVLDRDDIFYDGKPDYSRAENQRKRETNEIIFLPGKEDKVRTINYTLSVIRPTSQAFPAQEKGCIPQKVKSALDALFDFRLLKRSDFRMLVLVALLFPMGYNIPYIYTITRAEIPKEYAEMLPVVIGMTNILYRIVVGFLAYKIKVHVAYLAGIGMTLGGAITFTSGFVGQGSIVFQVVYAMCFAIGSASNGALRSTLYVKVVGLEKLTNAFGLTTMTSGVGAFVGTNAAGFLNDYMQGYTVSFMFSGISMLLAGFLNLCLPKYLEWQKVMEAKKAQKKVRFVGVASEKKWWQKWFSRRK